MSTGAIVAVALLVAVLVALASGAWFSWTAGRLDRMHLRCEASHAAVDAALVRRAALTLELAVQPTTDPASAVLLTDAATRTPVDDDARWQRESDLSVVLRAVGETAPQTPIWNDLVAAAQQVTLTRRINNDHVSTTLALRSRRRVRWFRLAGRAAAPTMIAFDDEPPARV